MARIRYIKPDFWTDTRIVCLSPLARLFYIGMWNFAVCDMGHVKDDPDALKLQILPTDDVSGDALVEELLKAGRVVRLTLTGGRTLLHIPRFSDHQPASPRWSPRCAGCQARQPNPPRSTEVSVDVQNFEEVSAKNTRLGRVGKGRDKETSSTATRSTVDDDPAFARFWDAYPRKVGKGEARKAWVKIIKAGVDPATVIAGAERYRDDPQRRSKADEFTKHPGPWLNAERWTDEPGRQLSAVPDLPVDGIGFVLPTPPRAVLDDPDTGAYLRWARAQRDAWQAAQS